MLNKNRFLAICAGLIVITFISYKLYINKKEDVIQYNNYISKLSQKIEYTNYLSNIFKIPNIKCSKKETADKIVYNCKNLNKNQLSRISNQLFDKMVNIKDFSIDSNATKTTLKVEILK